MKKHFLTFLPLFAITLSSCGTANYEEFKKRALEIIEYQQINSGTISPFTLKDTDSVFITIGNDSIFPNSFQLVQHSYAGETKDIIYSHNEIIYDINIDEKIYRETINVKHKEPNETYHLYYFEQNGRVYYLDERDNHYYVLPEGVKFDKTFVANINTYYYWTVGRVVTGYGEIYGVLDESETTPNRLKSTYFTEEEYRTLRSKLKCNNKYDLYFKGERKEVFDNNKKSYLKTSLEFNFIDGRCVSISDVSELVDIRKPDPIFFPDGLNRKDYTKNSITFVEKEVHIERPDISNYSIVPVPEY